jgi:hypothetical protein
MGMDSNRPILPYFAANKVYVSYALVRGIIGKPHTHRQVGFYSCEITLKYRKLYVHVICVC